MLYANYIRNKMHHLVKSVFASGYPLKIISKFKKKAVNYTIHGKTEIGKNLIPYPYMYTTRTVNGVTYTDNGDGSVTVSGTATGYSDFFFKIMSIAPNTTFTFSKNQSDDAANMAFVLRQLDENRALIGTEITLIPTVATHTFTTDENTRYIQIACKRYTNAECKGTYKPMLELGNTATEYEKYTVYGVGDKTKNLIPYPYANTTKTVNGITFTDNGDGTITVNGTATANTQFIINHNIISPEIDKTQSYTFSIGTNLDISDARVAITLYKDVAVVKSFAVVNQLALDLSDYDFDRMYCYILIMKDKTVNNIEIRPQLEFSNTATDYEPYGYKIPLVNRGKNLLNVPYMSATQTNNYFSAGTYTDLQKYFPGFEYCKGKRISFSSVSSNSVFVPEIVFYYSDGSTSTVHDNTTIPEAASLIRIEIRARSNSADYNGTTVTLTNIQLELGNTATEYEPYRAPDTTNVYHTAPLKDGDSISYKADGLPELQLYKGENNITADTAVAPSAIDIKYLN